MADITRSSSKKIERSGIHQERRFARYFGSVRRNGVGDIQRRLTSSAADNSNHFGGVDGIGIAAPGNVAIGADQHQFALIKPSDVLLI